MYNNIANRPGKKKKNVNASHRPPRLREKHGIKRKEAKTDLKVKYSKVESKFNPRIPRGRGEGIECWEE